MLTLEPDLTEEKRNCKKRIGETPGACSREPVLSPQEQKIVEDFCSKDRY